MAISRPGACLCSSRWSTMRRKTWRTTLPGLLTTPSVTERIVARFGRFPHRNKVLGRASTEEEDEYLASGGDRF